MAIGPTLGTGLFVGIGQALAVGGPASLIISYVFLSVLVYFVTTATAEVSTHSLARNGAMIAHTYHYSSSHLGFAISYLRWCALAVFVPFEVTTAMVHLGLWEPSGRMALRMGVVTGVIVAFNMLPDKLFRRSQAFFTCIKFSAMVGILGVSSYLAIRASADENVKGFLYWREPGPFNQFLLRGGMGRALGLVDCLLCSTIAFVFIPELTVQRAEQHDTEPGNSIFRRTRNSNIVFFVLYILSSFASTVMAPSTDPSLTNNGTGAGLSPFVVGVNNSHVRVIPGVTTALILISSVASGRSFLHLSSRMLTSMAETGHAPAMFMVRNRWEVPYVSVGVSAGFTWLTFLCMAVSSSAVHNYLMFFITTSGYISWICSGITYLRFRQVANDADIMPVHRSFVQPYGTWFALVASTLLALLNCLQIIVAHTHLFNPWNAIPGYISLGMFSLMYLGHRLVTAVRNKAAQFKAPSVKARHEAEDGEGHGQDLELHEVDPTPYSIS
ncbi:amino acid permease/ SLC12A domain-containing protein [Aspergillus egyptiacus]|nr:amino acid permease/ SLC12A domain-containing protein [Aspergillus egyptiacus]